MEPTVEQPVVEQAPVLEPVPVVEAPAVEEPKEAVAQTVQPAGHTENYPSLYDSIPTTFGAILLGAAIIAGIQWLVRTIFIREKAEHKALTQFVTAMFALIAGLWVADKLIAGPDTELLLPGESTSILTFIKDITLMVFSYYFGTKAQVPPDMPSNDEEGV